MCLDAARPLVAVTTPELSRIHTPLNIQEWSRTLQNHPDKAFGKYIIKGLECGFRIGFRRSSQLRAATSNMRSAYMHPQVISDYLKKELSLERMLGPFHPSTPGLDEVHTNRFGVIPKGHNTGKWRLITDLSYPPGLSVNDGIDSDLCSLSYIKVDHVAQIVSNLGRGALLAKVDIESAYRLIPVHPDDRPLQAVQWEGQIFVDPMLPFGLCSAPKIFNAVADAFQWVVKQRGVSYVLHYLDDYIIIGPPQSPCCQQDLDTLLQAAASLGIPIAKQKTEGPTTELVFLGITIDTVRGELRLPEDKLRRLEESLTEWGDRRVCSRKELESLIGHLNHAGKVVRAGRSFLRRMLDLLHGRSNQHVSIPIRLNCDFRADLLWWRSFVAGWNGTSFLDCPETLPKIHAASDASGRWGCGAWSLPQWFQWEWSEDTRDLPIAVKEFIPIILGCAVWGYLWAGHCIIWHCDNQAVVGCLESRTSKNPLLMHLIRNITFIEAYGGFHVRPVYISTRDNHLADDLSRNRLSSFLLKVPAELRDPWPTPTPVQLVNLFLNNEADWISLPWRRQFKHTLDRVWRAQPRDPMMRPRSDFISSAAATMFLPPFPSQSRPSVPSQPTWPMRN